MNEPKYALTKVILPRTGEVKIYASKRIRTALSILQSTSLFKGVKILQLVEAAYLQGKKDGARAVFNRLEDVKKEIPHTDPGRPRIRKRK